MKALHITGTKENLNNMRDRVRVGIILTGIATAILCLLALVYETPSAENEASTNRFIGTSKITMADFSVEGAGRAVVSAMWPF